MNILTIDLEDWFHILDLPEYSYPGKWETMESRVERNTDRILELLDARKQKSTWFCLGWIAEKYPELIKRISSHHEIGAHSMYHDLLYKQGKKAAADDLRRNISILEQLSGQKINSYRAPGFSFTNQTKWHIEILSEQNISVDCSLFPAGRNHGGYPAFPASTPCIIEYDGYSVKELPLNKTSFFGINLIFSGGGYFRALPYHLIRSAIQKSDYVMTYFHPRDFDNEQPVLDRISFKRKLMSYTGLKKSFSKFERMLNDFNFVSVNDAVNLIDWNKMPVINLSNI